MPIDGVPAHRAVLLVDRDTSELYSSQLSAGEVVALSVARPFSAGPNEDGAGIVDIGGASVLVVADGAGGLPAGEVASSLAVQSVVEAVVAADGRGQSLRDGILDGFEDAHRRIIELGSGAATTLAVVEIRDRVLRSYHAGDSPVLVTGQRGKRKLLTVSHSPVGYLVESGALSESHALHHEELHVVSNLVGVEGMRIELGAPIALSPRDTVVLGSDGLFDNLTPDEVADIVRKGSLAEVGARLRGVCSERMVNGTGTVPSKPDDLTFVLYRAATMPGEGPTTGAIDLRLLERRNRSK